MTIILVGMNDEFAVQLSDRRLSWGGIITEEEHEKCFSLFLPGFRFTVAFTGLAKLGTFETANYLFTQLASIGAVSSEPINIIELLGKSLTHRFTTYRDILSLPLSRRALTISIVGYNFTHNPPLGVAAQISNTASDAGAFNTHFESQNPNSPQPANESWTWMGAFGNGSALDYQGIEAVRSLLKKRASLNAIIGKFEKAIRLMSDDPRSANTIGKQIDHITIYSDYAKAAQGGRSSSVIQAAASMPGAVMIGAGGQVAMARNLSITPVSVGASPLTVPKVHRNQPCPCGSGKRFRDCHRR